MCNQISNSWQISAIEFIGSKEPKTVVPAVALTKIGTSFDFIASFIISLRIIVCIFPLGKIFFKKIKLLVTVQAI